MDKQVMMMKGFADARIMGKVARHEAGDARTRLDVVVGLRDGSQATIAVSLVERAHGGDIRVGDAVLVWGELRGGGEIWVDGWGECRVVHRSGSDASRTSGSSGIPTEEDKPASLATPQQTSSPAHEVGVAPVPEPTVIAERTVVREEAELIAPVPFVARNPSRFTPSVRASPSPAPLTAKATPASSSQSPASGGDDEFLTPTVAATALREPEEAENSLAQAGGEKPGDQLPNATGGPVMRRAPPAFLPRPPGTPVRPAPRPLPAPAAPAAANPVTPAPNVEATTQTMPGRAAPVEPVQAPRFTSSRKVFRTTMDQTDLRAAAVSVGDDQ